MLWWLLPQWFGAIQARAALDASGGASTAGEALGLLLTLTKAS